MKIFCDGVFDLFHFGHVNHFKKIKQTYPKSTLLVGVLDDKECISYKRKPTFNQKQRLEFVNSCKYVDEVTLEYPSIMTKDYMDKNNIDLVVHAFSNKKDYEKQLHFFKIPIELNKFSVIDYDTRISSSTILDQLNENKINLFESNKNGWDLIWEKKGNIVENDITLLNGYEDTEFNAKKCFKNIIENLRLDKDDIILEVGCGAGLISQYFKDYNYFGIDYSLSLTLKNIKLFNNKIYNCEAKELPFKNKYFDYTFSVGVFEYFPSKEYMKQVLNELERVTKKGIYIINLRSNTHTQKKTKHKFEGVFTHIIYTKEDFNGYKEIEPTYEKNDRFSVIKFLL